MPKSKEPKPQPMEDDYRDLETILAALCEESGIEVGPHHVYITFGGKTSDTKLIPADYKVFTDKEFYIKICFEEWIAANPDQKHAIVHEQLCACGYDEDKPVKRLPDFKGYAANAAKFGAWHGGAQLVAKAIKKYDQLNLLENDQEGDSDEILDNVTPIVARKKAS